ncbi:MAG: ABC transporter permease [Ignavibacteriaceae bacterium]
MLKNYLTIALRNIIRQKLYSFINIMGLAFGIAVCLVIFLFISDELSFDQFHQNSGSIYRVVISNADLTETSGVTPLPLAEALETDFPELEVVQTKASYNVISYEEKTFTEKNFYYTDPNFLKIFSFQLLKGDPARVLQKPGSVVINENMAKKYFGNEEPIGKTILNDNRDPLIVTGIMKNFPENSYMQYDFLGVKSDHVKDWPDELKKDWHPRMFSTFILTPSNYSVQALDKKMPAFLEKYVGKEEAKYQRLVLQPLKDIYLHSTDIKFNPMDKTGDIKEIYIFSIIAVFILILACINYMNLSTSRYSNRMNEIGIRKVIGAGRKQLAYQFLGESVVTSFIAVSVSVFLVELFLPVFNSMMDKNIEFKFFNDPVLLAGLISGALIIGIISGSYPAIFLSAFHPIKIIRSSAAPGLKNLSIRRILIVVQFSIAVALIVCLTVVFAQMKFLTNKNLGFEKENLLSIDIPYQLRSKFEAFKREALKDKHIINMAMAESVFPNRLGTTNKVDFNLNGERKTVWVHVMSADFDLIETLGLKIKSGRSFSKEFQTDEKESLVFNESAINAAGIKDPVGQEVDYFTGKKKIIGVVKDFHYWRLHEKIEPVVIMINKIQCWNIAVRISGHNIIPTMDILRDKWKLVFPGWPLEFTFADDNLNKLYQKEIKLEKLAEYLTFIALFIACLGLFGLSAFAAEKRTKEIGIRKVLGASITSIVKIFSKEFLILVGISNLIAWPLAYYLMNNWLQDFAYHVDIGYWVFLLAGGSAIIISLLTVSFQAIKAATANPVESLKYE